jgi:predicted secreted protein
MKTTLSSGGRGSLVRISAMLALLLPAASGVAAADDDNDATRRISFQVERSREVSNDWLQANMTVNDEDADSAALADRVNRKMTWALEQARSAEGVKVESGGYHTSPVIEKGRTRRWRASQSLRIEAEDFKAATELIGVLQERMQLQGLHFSVSPKQRRKVEDALIEEVLDAFKKRAKLVGDELGAKGYEIVRIDLQTGGGMPRPMVHGMRAMASAEMAAPAVEGGTSRVSVGASATIELE